MINRKNMDERGFICDSENGAFFSWLLMPTKSPAQNLPAFSFLDGSLCIRKPGITMDIAGWPEPNAVRLATGTSWWKPFQPDFRLVHPYRSKKQTKKKKPAAENSEQTSFDFFEETRQVVPAVRLTPEQQKKRAFDSFRFSLPKDVARILEPFRSHQWPLLVLLRDDPGAVDLAKSNPALAFFLAHKMNCDRELIRSLKCCSMRRKDLLEVLGFEPSKRAVSFFQKICPASITGDNWWDVVDLLQREAAKEKSHLNHLPVINSGVVEIMLDPNASGAATPTLLEEVAKDRSENYRGRVVHLITSTLCMQQELQTGPNHHSFANVTRLREIHDQVSDNYRRRIRQLGEVSNESSDYFRSPPLRGIPGKIEPITSPQSLVNEGEEQGNCVASYAARVKSGTTFIYRVFHPQRATLSLIRSDVESTDWEISELEGKFNTPANSETEEFVQSWLDRNQDTVLRV